MAVYFTLAIDCADNKIAAEQIAQRFSDYQIELSVDGKVEFVECGSESYNARRYWNERERLDPQLPDWNMVCVTQQIGYGSGRQDLMSEENLRAVRNDLYGRMAGTNCDLPAATGFRSAQFGVERQDFLGDEDWLKTLGAFLLTRKPGKYFEGLILSETIVRNPSLRKHLTEFSPGFLWWDCFPDRYY